MECNSGGDCGGEEDGRVRMESEADGVTGHGAGGGRQVRAGDAAMDMPLRDELFNRLMR